MINWLLSPAANQKSSAPGWPVVIAGGLLGFAVNHELHSDLLGILTLIVAVFVLPMLIPFFRRY